MREREEVKLGCGGQPTPELTRRSSPERPETAEGLGIPPPVTKWPAEGIYVELGLARIHLCKQQGLRWPELAGGKLSAVAVVRAMMKTLLWCTAGATVGCSGPVELCRAR